MRRRVAFSFPPLPNTKRPIIRFLGGWGKKINFHYRDEELDLVEHRRVCHQWNSFHYDAVMIFFFLENRQPVSLT